MWIISFMGETWSIIVCMLCTRVASLQRSTLHISNWKNIFFKGGKECYNWEWLESGCWLMADQRRVKIVGCITVCFMGWWMILCQCWSLLMLNLKCRFPNPEKKSTLSKCIVRSISGTQLDATTPPLHESCPHGYLSSDTGWWSHGHSMDALPWSQICSNLHISFMNW